MLFWATCVCFRYETGHQPVGDGGTNPDFREHIVGILAVGLQIDVVVIERGNEYVDDADEPQVALGVALPVSAGIKKRERAEQQHGEDETYQMERVEDQGRREENVAQQYRDAHGNGTPVVKLVGGDTVVEEVHPYHDQTGHIEDVED